MEVSLNSLEAAAHTHDGFFKAIFSQPEHATAFFKSHLPAGVADVIDWPTLVVLPGSFVKSSLQQVHSDLLFSVRIGQREALLYLLFEHQSTPDPAMPLRLLGYMTEIFTRYHKDHQLPLVPVLPFVFHQGPESWKASTAFEDLFGLTDETRGALLPYLPKFHHALLDLTRFDPAVDEDNTRLRAVLQLMKLAREKQLLRFFQWLSDFPADELPEALIGPILLYAMHSDSDLDVEKIYHTLSSNPELEKNTMSVAEKLIAKGRVEGRVEGLDKGSWRGKIQAFEEFLGKPITPAAVLDALSFAELEDRYSMVHREYEVRFKRG